MDNEQDDPDQEQHPRNLRGHSRDTGDSQYSRNKTHNEKQQSVMQHVAISFAEWLAGDVPVVHGWRE
jgi:hypothetical protein